MKSAFIEPEVFEHVLFALTSENALVCRVCLKTGLRVGDVVSLKTETIRQGIDNKYKIKVTEQKTKKKKTVTLGKDLTEKLLIQSGSVYVFQGRSGADTHRTRQTVYKDLKRAGKLFRLKENLTPHTTRKIYAVELYRKYGNIKKVQHALNHNNDVVTMIYALADKIQAKK